MYRHAAHYVSIGKPWLVLSKVILIADNLIIVITIKRFDESKGTGVLCRITSRRF